MKKINFSDKFALTQAVLDGRKTQTRRMVHDNTPIGNWSETIKKSRYQVGEVVAVAQRYRDLFPNGSIVIPAHMGWFNKLFVKADEMPHRIRITDVRVERLNDISEDDCIAEGVLHSDKYAMPYGIPDSKAPNGVDFYYSTPREAYAALIDRISGKGTWQSNPYVFAYTFELVK